MNLIKPQQIHRGSRLSFSNVKKYSIQGFWLSETARTEFKITNKPPGTYFTSLYTDFDNKSDYVQIDINHNTYYQGEDFTFDKDTGKITWTNTAAKNGFDLTKDIADYIRVKFAYTYEKVTNRFIFNKTNNYGPIELEANEVIYPIHGEKNPLFDISDEDFTINIPYNSNASVVINKELFTGEFQNGDGFGGGLESFFWNNKVRLVREKNNAGVIFRSASFVLPSDEDGCSIVYDSSYVSSAVNSGSFNDLYTAYNNGENLIAEFIG